MAGPNEKGFMNGQMPTVSDGNICQRKKIVFHAKTLTSDWHETGINISPSLE